MKKLCPNPTKLLLKGLEILIILNLTKSKTSKKCERMWKHFTNAMSITLKLKYKYFSGKSDSKVQAVYSVSDILLIVTVS